MKLNDQHIFVTGGADGIGAAIVLDAVEQGARVSFCDVSVDKGNQYAQLLRKQGYKVLFHEADVGKFDSLKIAHDAFVAEFGMVNGVVNNAGINLGADPVTLTDEEWEHFMGIDFKSVWHTAKLVLPAMREAHKGSIVSIASLHARMTFPKYFPYAGAKAGIIGLTHNLCLDEGPKGIRVNTVSPGYTLTPLLEEWFVKLPEKRTESMAVQPMGRMGKPSEIAKVVTFLLSDDASFVNGSDFLVDGGLHARFA